MEFRRKLVPETRSSLGYGTVEKSRIRVPHQHSYPVRTVLQNRKPLQCATHIARDRGVFRDTPN